MIQRVWRRLIPACSCVVVTIALSAGPAWAQKTDRVTLTNGDRITGEITSLARGRLELKTDDAGTIDIEWDNITSVEAKNQFEVATSDGRRLLGSLQRTVDRVLGVVVGNDLVSLPMPEVTSITPIGAGFWARLEGAIDMGFSYTRSSGVAQVNFSGDTEFRRPAFAVRLDGSGTVTERSDGSGRDDRGDLEFTYVRNRGPNWFISGAARLENNESLGLLLRSQVGGLVGRRIVNTNRAQLEVGAGIVGNNERGVDSEPTQNIEAVFGVRASYYSYDRPRTNIDTSVQYYPSLSDWGRQRLQLDASFKREVWKDFYLSLDTYVTFDSAPPNPSAFRTDVGLVTSIGWSY